MVKSKVSKIKTIEEVKINFAAIEKKWQKKWEEGKIFEVSEKSKKKKFYCLEMYPYPSGSGLHMGHAFNYIIGDIQARFRRMQGFNVLHPMGYDSFGLPAENAAIREGVHPQEYTDTAIKNYIKQQKMLGLSYDWTRILWSHNPEYYKWNQWIFLKMLKKGLAYRKNASVNWCAKCNSVLANEQVHSGKCWRHEDVEVEIKHIEQWFLKTTAYAEELLMNENNLDWPNRIKSMQENWIGRSEGTEIIFEVNKAKWPVFTTRPDTLFGVTFLVVSAQHSKLMELVTAKQKKEVESFLKKIKSTSEKDAIDLEKQGVFTGSYAIHPLTKEKIPVWTGNFVIADYGSGMVMAVPAHDQRDFEFAKKYKIPIKVVIDPIDQKISSNTLKEAYTGPGNLMNSEGFDDLASPEAKDHITKALEFKKLGKKSVQYKLRDWLVSRQRYWGTPIPVIYCDKCGIVPVSEKDLPVELPKKVKFGKGNPLETNKEFVNVNCPNCKGKARRETDTMDTFFDSSWYYLRYADAKNKKMPFDSKNAEYWMPVDFYTGGAEHACMHLIYARFFTKVLRDLGLIKLDEPFKKLFNQGMVHKDGVVMSKSKGNVVLPEEVSNKYGIDTARLFLMAIAHPSKDIEWSENGIDGSSRFAMKVFDYFNSIKISKSSNKVEHKINSAIKSVTNNLESIDYNIAIIKLRELFDFLSTEKEISKKDSESAIKMLSPFCPHISEELWEKIGGKGFVSLAEWPEADESKIDEKFEKAEKDLDKTVSDILNVLKIVKEKSGEEGEKVYLYVIPNELGNYDISFLTKRVGKEVKVFAVNDKKKYDPQGKASKAKPGKPGIYIE